ncbi:MAG: N-acetylglucosamine-specific PTS transporter subunit IIBC [Burkholderiales bacterium]|nr:N-acetylglucosamine-specific PTS transporter subunit IIBC [Burkholderiales bacterium]
MKFKFSSIQSLGRALMLPIAMLPVAGLLLRFGQPDLLNIAAISDAGGAIFSNLPLLFAIGVSVGFAKDNNGSAGLAGAVGYLIFVALLKGVNQNIDTGVFGGIIIGSIAGFLYNKYKDIKLPEFLAFFGGKRFIPIATGVSAVILGGIFGLIWPPIQNILHSFSYWMSTSGELGLFLYGFLNRVLLVTGLHHVLNSLFWFQLGDFTNAHGVIVHGDIARFMSGDSSAGYFMAGYFPIMMFGLPAICLAMYTTSHQENRKAVAGLLLSMALTSFLTGVTEPIEYSFVFLAPVLYLIHAILTGVSLTLMEFMHIRLGFSFSAGAIDYILFFKIAQNPLYMLPIGILMFIVYWSVGVFFIKKLNLKTIGRESAEELRASEKLKLLSSANRDSQFITALGGADNLVNIDACTTRLRLIVKSNSNIDKSMLKALGAKGFVNPSDTTLQVILGPQAEIVASSLRDALGRVSVVSDIEAKQSNVDPLKEHTKTVLDIDKLILALGGLNNIVEIKLSAITRVQIKLIDYKLLSINKLTELGIQHIIDLSPDIKQLYIGFGATDLVAKFKDKIK